VADAALGLGGCSPPRPQKTKEPPLEPLSIFEKKGGGRRRGGRKGQRGRRNQSPLQPFLYPPLSIKVP